MRTNEISKGILIKTELLLCGRKIVNGKRTTTQLVQSDNPEILENIYKANKGNYSYFITYQISTYRNIFDTVTTVKNLTWRLYRNI